MTNSRLEVDSLGEVAVPENALYGAQTQRAIENFPVSGQVLPITFIKSLLIIKKAAALANAQLEQLPRPIAEAIANACDALLADEQLMQHFPVDIFQTGSGTSTNMNANEVLARLASRECQTVVHPNDHVNLAQSSNDVIPSTINLSAHTELANHLLPAMTHLSQCIEQKAQQLKQVCKTGRTHLMDAVPIRMDQALSAWQAQIDAQKASLTNALDSLSQLAIGGTAVGTGLNAHPQFAKLFHQQLSQLMAGSYQPTSNYFAAIASQESSVRVSGLLKSYATTLIKIANDLRWMNSGPTAGLSEITLPALQPGSSIMPGKVNPVIPESVAMVAAKVTGNDTTITIAGQSSNFELNVMLPLIGSCLLESIHILGSASRLLADKAIEGFQVNEQNLEQSLARNPILATALNPIVGYDVAATIAKRAYQEQKPIIDVAESMTDLSRDELTRLLDPTRLTQPNQD